MSYTKQTWSNAPATDTPLSATRLNYMEDGIAAAAATADSAASAASAAATSAAGATRPGGTDVAVADGGTGRSSHTAYGVIVGGTSTTAAQQSVTPVAAGQFLKSAGTSAIPAWAALSATDIADLQEWVQDMMATFIVAGANITKTYDDAGNTLTLAASGGGGSTAPTSVAVARVGTAQRNTTAASSPMSASPGASVEVQSGDVRPCLVAMVTVSHNSWFGPGNAAWSEPKGYDTLTVTSSLGDVLTFIGYGVDGPSGQNQGLVALFAKTDATVGVHNLPATVAEAGMGFDAIAVQGMVLTGVGSIGTPVTAPAGGAGALNLTVTSAAGSLVVVAGAFSTDITGFSGTTQWKLGSAVNGTADYSLLGTAPGATSVTLTTTSTGHVLGAIAASFNPPAASGSSYVFKQTMGSGVAGTETLQHNLNTLDVTSVEVYKTSAAGALTSVPAGARILVTPVIVDANTITITHSEAWGPGEFRAIVTVATSSVVSPVAALPIHGTFAARPAAGVGGRRYTCTDNGNEYRDNGSSWDLVTVAGTGLAGAVPLSTGWSLGTVSPGTTVTAERDTFAMSSVAYNQNVDIFNFHYRTLSPTSNYTATFCVDFLPTPYNGPGGYIALSDGTKFITFGFQTQASQQAALLVQQWNSATAIASSPFQSAGPAIAPFFNARWWRIRDDGTNLYFGVSLDGLDWWEVFSMGRTAWLTPTRIGWGMNAYGSGYTSRGRLRSLTGVN